MQCMVFETSFNVKSALSTLQSNIIIDGSFAPLTVTQVMRVNLCLVPSCRCGRVFVSFSAMTLDLCACNGNPDLSVLKMWLGKLITHLYYNDNLLPSLAYPTLALSLTKRTGSCSSLLSTSLDR